MLPPVFLQIFLGVDEGTTPAGANSLCQNEYCARMTTAATKVVEENHSVLWKVGRVDLGKLMNLEPFLHEPHVYIHVHL
jgi:hypothetical protein